MKRVEDVVAKRNGRGTRPATPTQEVELTGRCRDLARGESKVAAGADLESEPASPDTTAALYLIPAALGRCTAKLSEMSEKLERLDTTSHVIAELQVQCQKSDERFHEREVLGPMMLGLIAIADRCRGQITRIEQLLNRPKVVRGSPPAQALQAMLKSRAADLVEIESILACYSVEPFEHTEGVFDPSLQHCVRRVPRADVQHAGRIASRLQPGYRRFGRVVRPEYVEVFVNATDLQKGA